MSRTRQDRSEALVVREDDQGIVRLTMNLGERYNPLSRAMIGALGAEVDRVRTDAHARVVVLAGAGRGFSAGHDLAEMSRHVEDREWQEALFAECNALMESLPALPQPVIAEVHGIATAAGCQLAAMCDLVVAADSSRFALPGVNVGIFCSTPAVAVARRIGRSRTLELLLTGDPVDAATAERWGLANRVVPAAELEDVVTGLARSICARSAPVLANGKRAFYDQVDQPLDAAYRTAGAAMVCDLSAPDSAEGMSAFLGKRSPQWPSASPEQQPSRS